jgi:hypothetical protein
MTAKVEMITSQEKNELISFSNIISTINEKSNPFFNKKLIKGREGIINPATAITRYKCLILIGFSNSISRKNLNSPD